jgi:hypothetical protein
MATMMLAKEYKKMKAYQRSADMWKKTIQLAGNLKDTTKATRLSLEVYILLVIILQCVSSI